MRALLGMRQFQTEVQTDISGLKSNPAEEGLDVLVGSRFSISQKCPLATKTTAFLSELKTELSS